MGGDTLRDSDPKDIAGAPIGGLGVRLFAQFVDLVVWGLTATILAVGLVYLAPDTLGLANALPEYTKCEELKAVPPGIPATAGLTPNAAVFCSKLFFGVPFRDVVILSERHVDRGVTQEKSVTYAVDRNMRPKTAFDLDPLIWTAFLVYVVAAQARHGATFGKSALRLLVVGPDGRPPGWQAALVRNLVVLAPWLVWAALGLADLWSDTFFTNTALFLSVAGLTLVASWIIGIEIAMSAFRGRPGIHDRIAGTRVIRLPRRSDGTVARTPSG